MYIVYVIMNNYQTMKRTCIILTEISFSDSMRKRHPIFHLVYFCYIRFDEQKTFHVKVLFTQYYYFFNTNLINVYSGD